MFIVKLTHADVEELTAWAEADSYLLDEEMRQRLLSALDDATHVDLYNLGVYQAALEAAEADARQKEQEIENLRGVLGETLRRETRLREATEAFFKEDGSLAGAVTEANVRRALGRA